MKHQLSFGNINIHNGNIAEVIINKNIEMSLEMVEECEEFFDKHFPEYFGILVNKIHAYEYTFEAKLTIGTNKRLKAIAVVNYSNASKIQSDRIAALRQMDQLNMKNFSGLELGWQQSYEWLINELSA